MRRTLLPILTLLIGIALQSAQSFAGTITVKVVDQQGDPVASATVKIDPIDGRVRAFPIPECITGEDGICSHDFFEFIAYRISAMKVKEDYPDISLSLYAYDRKDVIAKITADSPNTEVSMMIGPKAGILTGRIFDSVTGAPIQNAGITLRRAADRGNYLSASLSPSFRILIPPNDDILIDVEALGYKTWKLKARSKGVKRGTLHLRSEEAMDLTIRLRPK